MSRVRYSEVMQAEKDFNNLTRSTTTGTSSSNPDYNDSTMSVTDARRRFEQLSSPPPASAPTHRRSEPSVHASKERSEAAISKDNKPARPPRPLMKRASDPAVPANPTPRPRGQSAANQNARLEETDSSETRSSQDVSGDSPKPKAKIFSKSLLRKSHSVKPTDLVTTSSEAETTASKISSASKKIFKRKSFEKSKMEGLAATNGSTKARTTKNGEASSNSPTSSPTRSKFSPLSSKKKRPSGSSSNSSQPSSPLAKKASTDKPAAEKTASLSKSLSDKVLTSTEERFVQATLKEEDKLVGGSRPSTPRVIEDGELKLNLTEDLNLSGAELKLILNKQLAYISGGLENSHLILTFPAVGLKLLENSQNFDELMTTIIYFKSLISIQQLSAGFTLILDAHSPKTHTPVRQLLERIVRKDFPLSIHMVCIFVKTGIFGRSKSLASPEVCTKLHLATFNDVKALVDQMGAENLTPDLGGTLSYDHNVWVCNRLEFEKTQVLHRRAMTRVPEVTEALRSCEVPQSVKDAEHLMQEDLKLKEILVNKIAEAELNIDRLLMALADGEGAESDSVVDIGTTEYITMQEALEGMSKDLRGSQGQFDSFWTVHKARTDHMMRMCHFKRTAEKLETMIKGYIDDLTAGGVHLGDTLELALELGEKHESFVNKCKMTMEDQMDKMREDSDVLTHPRFVSGGGEMKEDAHANTQKAVQSVNLTMKQLSSTHQQLITMCQQKRDLFIVCVKFHMTTRQCIQWNQDVLEFLASQPMESPSFRQATTLLNKIDEFFCRMQPSQIMSLQELVDALPGEKVFQRNVHKTLQKYEHSCELLNNRKAALLRVVSACSASPTPGAKAKGKKNKHDKLCDKPDIEILNSVDSGTVFSNAHATANPEASLYLAKTLASETSDYDDTEVDEAILKKRKFVYNELVTTEEDYIKDLRIVIDSYYDAMDDSDSLSMPLRLRGKRDVVFGNLLEIYKFHDVVFKKALEQFNDHPEAIGECFVQFTGEFQMYSIYCKNRSNSETLLNESTESEAFFKGIQRNLAHQLPLNSYLLKPVQRITKYQLLLKDMMKHSMNTKKAHSDLKQALDRMLKVLKNLNDSLHVVGLKGFPGALAEQGRLLVHDAFQMWDSSGASRSLFSRAKSRHVFLFEKVIIFSKKFEAPVQKKANKSDNYLYKGHLQLAELVLREIVDGQPLQFSLTVHGQHKDFRFQAVDKTIHTMWTSEIRRLLQVQFMLMKDMVINSGTLDRKAWKGKTRRTDSRLFGDSFKERPGDAQSKKSISDRFKWKKRKGSASDNLKIKKNSPNVESSLMASSSYPANVRFGLKGAPTSPNSLSLTQSNIEATRNMEEEQSSLSSDDDFQFSEEDDDEGSINTVSVDHYESLAPGAPRYYMAISAYSPGDSDDNGVALCMDQEVEVIGINLYGWWWVRATNPSNGEVEEGWVPASYLKVSGSAQLKP